MTKEQILLTRILKRSLDPSVPALPEELFRKLTDKDWDALLKVSDLHKVTGLIYDCIKGSKEVPPAKREYIRKAAVRTSLQNFRLLIFSRDIVDSLEKAGIIAVLLKGIGTASLYPEPLYRKSGDIDIFLPDPECLDDAIEVLEKAGLKVKEDQRALHHTVLSSDEDIDVELHTMLCEPLDNDRANLTVARRQADIAGDPDRYILRKNIMGVDIPVLKDSYYAYELLLHMLQHYLRSGFGIRLLCDWEVFWNGNVADIDIKEYLALTEECGIRKFSDMITLACYRYLGLKKEAVIRLGAGGFSKSDIDGFFDEFMNAGEFGKTSADRMVSLRGSGLTDYIREFHHQMKLNYPKESSNILLWPSLWIATLVIFLENNRKVRNVALKDVLKTAGNRGKLNSKLDLFER